MRCYNCGFENETGAPFCYNCGVNLKTFDGNVEVSKNRVKRQHHPAPAENSIQAKLMYKHDKRTGQLRIAKTKCATLIVFCAFTGFGLIIYSAMFGVAAGIVVSVIFGMIFALPVAILGYAVGLLIDKIFH